jgi:geranylgeranyl pyrophosphate synthase
MNNDIESINESLLKTTYEYIDRGGKRIRPILAILIAECL